MGNCWTAGTSSEPYLENPNAAIAAALAQYYKAREDVMTLYIELPMQVRYLMVQNEHYRDSSKFKLTELYTKLQKLGSEFREYFGYNNNEVELLLKNDYPLYDAAQNCLMNIKSP
jgi:hypothetical protein